MRPMKTGMVESSSATTKPAANNATNKPFAWRAKCQKKAMKPGGGSASPGKSVGFSSRSNSENMARARNGARPLCDAPRGAVERCDPSVLVYRIGGGG